MYLLLAALAGGAAATWLFDDDARLGERVAMGVPLGLAWLGLSGFAVASLLGMGPPTLGLSALLAVAPALVVAGSSARRRRVLSGVADARQALHRAARRKAATLAAIVACGLVTALSWRVYDRAMFLDEGAIHTGVDHNIGDLPFHLAIVTSFAYGENFPPEHPELAGARLTYPFLADFVSALLVAGGVSLRAALFSVNLLLALALVALLVRWGGRLTADWLAGRLTAALVLLSGGLGFWLLVPEARQAGGLWPALRSLSHDYTILSSGELRWGNAVVTLLVPQRSFLFGLPLFLVTWTAWWDALAGGAAADVKRAARRMAGAGLACGLLPLVHAHSFALALAMGTALAVLFPRPALWARFFAPATALGLPQLLWAGAGTSVQAEAFLGWHVGWDRGEQNPIWFWLYNTGLFIPALAAAATLVAVRRWGPPGLLRFYLPFTLCFVLPNLLRLSPWIWDNIKFLFYWWVASAALVALLLARMLRSGATGAVAGGALLLVLTLSGALDVGRVAAGAIRIPLFTQQAIAFAASVRETTPPRSRLVSAPTYNSPVLLTGRRSLLGYPGHIWSQGLDAGGREEEIRRIYLGRDAERLLERYQIDFVVVGPQERQSFEVAEPFLGRFPVVTEAAGHRLLAVSPAVVPLAPTQP